MADSKISDLTALTTQASGDLLPIVDVSEAAAADKNKSITVEELFRGIPVSVGIGTSTLANVLHVHQTDASANSYVHITQADGGSAATDGLSIGIEDGGVNAVIRNRENGYLRMYTNDEERLRIDSSGRLLVGTSSSLLSYAQLQVTGGSDNAGHICLASTSAAPPSGQNIGSQRYTNSGGGIGAIVGAEADSAWTEGSSYPTRLVFSTTASGASSPTTRMTIKSDGNVGINTTSPGQPLDVSGTARFGGSATKLTTYSDSTYAGFFNGSSLTSDESIYMGAGGTFFINNGNASVTIDSSSRVGIGTTSPSGLLHIQGNTCQMHFTDTDDASSSRIYQSGSTFAIDVDQANAKASSVFAIRVDDSERLRIDSSGRLLVGTTSSAVIGSSVAGKIQIADTNAAIASIGTYSGNSNGSVLVLGKSRSGGPGAYAIVQSGDLLGSLRFAGDDGTDYATQAANIEAYVDGTPGSNDMPGRLVFSTTADGASSPTERMRITNQGYTKFSDNASYLGAGSTYHEFNQSSDNVSLFVGASNASYGNTALYTHAVRAASSGYKFQQMTSGNFADVEFYFRGDGEAYADGTWNGGGADYAEYFEWSDGNTSSEDRRGISVVLDGDKIRKAVAGEEPIGVISGNPSVVGDADGDRWKGKYLRDDFGSYVWEDYEVVNDEGETVVQQRRKLNPDFNPDTEYVTRENRPEWDCVGLMGKLRIRKGQVTGTRWIKMRDISDNVEEWLVR